MLSDLLHFERTTGYLPGEVMLAIHGQAESEEKIAIVLDSAIAKLRKLQHEDELSDNEAKFLKQFGPVCDEYWGN